MKITRLPHLSESTPFDPQTRVDVFHDLCSPAIGNTTTLKKGVCHPCATLSFEELLRDTLQLIF
jgi:hypothetical protein